MYLIFFDLASCLVWSQHHFEKGSTAAPRAVCHGSLNTKIFAAFSSQRPQLHTCKTIRKSHPATCSKTGILAALKCIYWCVWCRSAPAHMMSEALQSVPGCTSIWATPSSSHAQCVPKDMNSHRSLPSNPSRAPAGDTAREALTHTSAEEYSSQSLVLVI